MQHARTLEDKSGGVPGELGDTVPGTEGAQTEDSSIIAGAS